MTTLGLQLGGLCDQSDPQRRYPWMGGDACQGEFHAAVRDDLAFHCPVIVANDPFLAPWNNNSQYDDGLTKKQKPLHVSHVFAHVVAGDLYYETTHCNNRLLRVGDRYDGLFVDQVVADPGEPDKYVWAYEGNRQRPSYAWRVATRRIGPYFWAKVPTDAFLGAVILARDVLTSIAVVEAARMWSGYKDADYQTMDYHLLHMLGNVPRIMFALEMYGVSADADGINDVNRLHAAASSNGLVGRCAPWFAIDPLLCGGPEGEAQALRYALERGIAQQYSSLGFYAWPASTEVIRQNTMRLLAEHRVV